MFSWSQKRQFFYFLIPFSVLVLILLFIYFTFFYKASTCFDGIKNGKESGVDCGGGCVLMCTGDNLEPIVLWSKAFAVTSDVYNLVAFVQNPNIKSSSKDAYYTFRAYDGEGLLIGERSGITSVPKNRKFPVFEGGFKSTKPIKRVDFDFQDLTWQKDESLVKDFIINNSPLENEKISPKVKGTIFNKSENAKTVELVVFVYDGKGNVVAVSKTVINDLLKNSTENFTFTWPKPLNLGEDICEIPSAVSIAIDRSGSMASVSKNPPEPLSSVKETALNFALKFGSENLLGVVSFADSADPIDQHLTDNKQLLTNSIKNINISTSSLNTNIADGLLKSSEILAEDFLGMKKSIVLLTDGKPTMPIDKLNPKYPYEYALSIASDIKATNISIYTIGLGKDIDSDFLKQIASDENKYFFAPDTKSLDSIYKEISSSICKRKPNVIEVLYNLK